MRPSEPCPSPVRGLVAALPILRLGPALAVLIEDVPDDAGVRTAVAQSRLRVAAGRPDIVIGRRPSGRPRLALPDPELGVSLSHRRGLLLAAFSPASDIGADLEIASDDLDPGRLAADHFSPGEADAIARLPPGRARDLFLRLWVAKEAALKIIGRGVYDGMAAPELTGRLDDLQIDGAPIPLPATARLPALRLTVGCTTTAGGQAVYCGLAAKQAASAGA